MKKQIVLFALAAAALMAAPAVVRAEDKPAMPGAAESGTPKAKKLPFHGNVTAVDTTGMTVTLANQKFHVTSDTKIMKEGKPATLADITVGEKITGQYTKDDAGKLDATVIHIGGKGDKGETNKKKADTAE